MTFFAAFIAFVSQRVARAVRPRYAGPGHARRAHPARNIAAFGCALAILAPHNLTAPLASTSRPAGTTVAMAAELTVGNPPEAHAASGIVAKSAFWSHVMHPDRLVAKRPSKVADIAFIANNNDTSRHLRNVASSSSSASALASASVSLGRSGGGAGMGGGAYSFERSAGGAGARNGRVGVSHGWETPGVPDTHPRAAPRPARELARETTRNGFAIATAPYQYAFPRDHASHPEYQTEWWYYTGHVRTKQGRRFGYELTFFRVGLRPGDPQPAPTQSKWRGNQLYPAHFALTDEQGKTFFHVDRFAREALGMGSASQSGLDVKADDWWLRGGPTGNPDFERMAMHASQATPQGLNAIDFVQMPEKKPAVHGIEGVSRKAGCASCASHYYSYTRLRTTGTLTYGGERLAVDGISWMDHEFGSGELQRNQAGWDWFSVQLDDGRELMLYLLREKDGSVTPQSSGSLVERDGTVRHLERGDFAIEATGRWKSPHTGGTYPSGWRVRVPRVGVILVLAPTVLDQELAGTSAGGVSYWEGAVDARDPSGRTLGVGYVELTGYAGSVSI